MFWEKVPNLMVTSNADNASAGTYDEGSRISLGKACKSQA